MASDDDIRIDQRFINGEEGTQYETWLDGTGMRWFSVTVGNPPNNPHLPDFRAACGQLRADDVARRNGFGKPDDADGREAPKQRSTSATLHAPLPRNALQPRRRTDALLGGLAWMEPGR